MRRIKPVEWVLLSMFVALLCVGVGCSSEGVGKGPAVQAVGMGAVTTFLVDATGVATGGWSVLVGIAVGLMRLLFASSTSGAPPGVEAGATVVQHGCPWIVLILLVVWLKKNRLWQVVTGGVDGRWNALKRLFGIKVKDPIVQPKEPA